MPESDPNPAKVPVTIPLRISHKTLAILAMCAMKKTCEMRIPAYQMMCEKYSEKAIRIKMSELAERGYIEMVGVRTSLHRSWLTVKGRQALESHVIIG